MKTAATVIQDSISPNGVRLVTMQIEFPRFILPEFNTHRVFSRNFRSSRAVPVATLVNEVRTSPFIPLQFTKNRAGMQGGAPLTDDEARNAESVWRTAAKVAADHAEWLAKVGVHKQYANRGLEPYMYTHGVVSSTEWENFFDLRCHPDAQPEFQELACKMRIALEDSEPVLRLNDTIDEVRTGGYYEASWHLPYVNDYERKNYGLEFLKKMSAARCAWVSYKPFDQASDDYVLNIEKINNTFDKLAGSRPIHASPFEHQATPGTRNGNFRGWLQQRGMIEGKRRAEA